MAAKPKKAPAKGAAKKSPTKTAKTAKNTRENFERVRPQFQVLRLGVIHIRAGRGDATSEIAEQLGVNRSYVIRLTDFDMKPSNDAEKRIMKAVKEDANGLARLGLGFGVKDGFTTTLAGDDGRRGMGGGRPRKDAKATKPKAPAKKAAPAKKKVATKAVPAKVPVKSVKKKVVAKRPAPKEAAESAPESLKSAGMPDPDTLLNTPAGSLTGVG